ncbi:MAG TPA: C4-type zinc ribbon domain-containing protein [Candidatus Dormibacteraeota bacterium]|nr:C4-type zinc ribbon domain-containing protein [Candidatus Dormibacteraeota bacterium]
MNDDLRRLVRVQEIMVVIDALQEKIAAMPSEVARLEKELLAAQKDADADRARVGELSKDRRRLEMELMGIESKITKYQSQLQDVKTNKEYQAMLHEIESCKAERAALDEKILLEMDESEKRNAALRSMEETLERRRRETSQGKGRLDAEAQDLGRQAGALESERAAIMTGIAPAYLEPFLKVARQRKGLALVAVRDERCGGCHVRVMPKLIQQVRRATGLIACDSCKRFLYVPDDPPRATVAAAESPAQ